MSLILHITHQDQWQQAKQQGFYTCESLESEGFIHCSTPEQVVWVANRFYLAQRSLVLLCIDSEKVEAEIRYETVEGNKQFPHLYGQLNLAAVVDVVNFEPEQNGEFSLPPQLQRFLEDKQI